jgi:hypothetical protein
MPSESTRVELPCPNGVHLSREERSELKASELMLNKLSAKCFEASASVKEYIKYNYINYLRTQWPALHPQMRLLQPSPRPRAKMLASRRHELRATFPDRRDLR